MPKSNRWGKSALALLLGASLVAPTGTALAQTTHTVAPGDVMYNIAGSYGVTVEEIMAWNGLSDSYLDVGDQLVIYGTGGGDVGTSTPAPTTPANAPSGVYTVQAGDTLEIIAATFGVTIDELYAWNGLSSSYLDVGDQLAVVPTSGTVTNPPSSGPENTAPATNAAGYHTVTAGENMWDLAWYYGTTVEQLMAMNGLSSDYLDVGDVLAVPNAPVNDYYYDPAMNDYEVPTSTAQNSSTADDGSMVHTVQAGDSLSSIATTYGITVDDLYTWNGLSSDALNVGDQLTVYPSGPVDASEVVEVTDPNGETSEVDLSELPELARPDTHIVEQGENIWSIAAEHDISAQSIRVWNELPEGDDSLTIGQEIYVSNPAFIPQVHEAAEGENLATIATEYETTSENIVTWNELANETDFAVGDQLIVSDPDPETHTVEPGETLETIAEAYNVTVDQLRQWNFIPENTDIVNGTLIVSDPRGVEAEAEAESGTESEASSEEAETSSDESSAE